MSRLIPAVVLTGALLPGAAAAQGVCVDCREPERSYRCTIKDSEKVQHVRGSSRAIEFLCISELARAGGHQSCRVSTSYSGPCIGQHYEVDLAKAAGDSVIIGRPPGEEGGPAAAQPAPPAPAGPAGKKGPPQTLEELARETMSKSKEQLAVADEKMKKTGTAVGGAVKKTWDCLASLFARC